MASVLVIDDDSSIRRIIRHVFEARGWKVQEASDGERGLNCQALEPADIVITDIEMPGMNGLELIAAIRRWGTSVPIVAITGAPGGLCLDLLTLAMKVGATATLSKPFSVGDLFTTAERLVLHRQLMRYQPGTATTELLPGTPESES